MKKAIIEGTILLLVWALISLAMATLAAATPLGEVVLEGNFTVTPWDAVQFGYFGPLTFTSVTDIFTPYAAIGDVVPSFQLLYDDLTWSIGSITVTSDHLYAVGSSWGGLYVKGGETHIIAPTFDTPIHQWSYWFFTAPPFEPWQEIATGPVTLTLRAAGTNDRVPEPSTLTLLLLGIIGAVTTRLRRVWTWLRDAWTR